MTLTQLEYVITLDSCGSFGEAAVKCAVTQPTMSMQVKKLEEELGVVLFDRSRQPVLVTDAGIAIVEQARVILREAGRLKAIVQEQQDQLGGNLHVGIIPTIAPYLMPYFLKEFTKTYPDVQLHIEELRTEEIITALQKDELDVAVLATPLHEPSIREEFLYDEEIMLYLHSKHPLNQKSRINAKQLDPSEMWMLTKGNCFRDHVINLCSLVRNQPISNFRYESGSLETLKRMVDMEGGYTLLPELAIQDLPSRELKRIRRFKNPVPVREVSLVYARSVIKEPMIKALKEVISTHLPEEVTGLRKGHKVEWR